jgi:hypothetical protein
MAGKNKLETSIECSIERKEKERLYGQGREREREREREKNTIYTKDFLRILSRLYKLGSVE